MPLVHNFFREVNLKLSEGISLVCIVRARRAYSINLVKRCWRPAIERSVNQGYVIILRPQRSEVHHPTVGRELDNLHNKGKRQLTS